MSQPKTQTTPTEAATTCQHVVFIHPDSIRCFFCNVEINPVKIKHPLLARLWAYWWLIKQKGK